MTEQTTEHFNIDPNQFLLALGQQPDAIHPFLHNLLKKSYPELSLMETDCNYFRPWSLNDLWSVSVAEDPRADSQFDVDWSVKKEKIRHDVYSGWFQATWAGNKIQLLLIGTKGSYCRDLRWYILSESKEINEGFFAEVCKFHSTVKGEVLVFQEGHWYPDADLFDSVKQTNLEDLVLHGDLKNDVANDLQMFFEQEETFRRYKIPWKRGIMLLGPPGNGKTHMIKGLVNRFDLPCLYVKSFDGHHVSPQQCVASAFARARETAPCLLILEDLDTLLTDENRSFFLNEMDGFASNDGIVTIASCNFPEKLDAAIMERPSRFDRKYHFELPGWAERHQYLAIFMQRFDAEVQLDEAGLKAIAKATDGYSFAYLKELYVSSVVRWVSTDRHRKIVDVMSEQAKSLRSQMATEAAAPAVASQPSRHRYPFFPPGMFGQESNDD